MQQQIFAYYGFQLAKELSRLLDELSNTIKNKTIELNERGGPAIIKPKQISSITEETQQRLFLQQIVQNLKEKQIKARLWLLECKRSPLRRFKLDFEDLKWIKQL